MSVNLKLEKPAGYPEQGSPVKLRLHSKWHQDLHEHKHVTVNGNFDLAIAVYQTAGRVRGILESFGHLPIAGRIEIVATPDHYQFAGELTCYSPDARRWAEKLLAMADSAIYSMRRECGNVIKEFRMTLDQTCDCSCEPV